VAQTGARLKEAQKLGFARAIVPEAARSEGSEQALSLQFVAKLTDLVADIAAVEPPTAPRNLREDRRHKAGIT